VVERICLELHQRVRLGRVQRNTVLTQLGKQLIEQARGGTRASATSSAT